MGIYRVYLTVMGMGVVEQWVGHHAAPRPMWPIQKFGINYSEHDLICGVIN